MEYGFSLESRHAEKSKIAANWISRMRQCMTEGEEPQILADALRQARITPSHLDGRLHLGVRSGARNLVASGFRSRGDRLATSPTALVAESNDREWPPPIVSAKRSSGPR